MKREPAAPQPKLPRLPGESEGAHGHDAASRAGEDANAIARLDPVEGVWPSSPRDAGLPTATHRDSGEEANRPEFPSHSFLAALPHPHAHATPSVEDENVAIDATLRPKADREAHRRCGDEGAPHDAEGSEEVGDGQDD